MKDKTTKYLTYNHQSWLEIKNTIERDDSILKNLPKTLRIEDPDYYSGLLKINIVFFIFAGVILLLIFIYLLLRFCCKKCIGPVKNSQVTKSYKQTTAALTSNIY